MAFYTLAPLISAVFSHVSSPKSKDLFDAMAIEVSATPVSLPTTTASSISSSVSSSESTKGSTEPIDRPVSAYVGLPPWTEKNEKALLAPYTYIVSIPGKDLRTQLLRAFNAWYNLPDHTFNVISEVVGMLHNASLV